MVYGQTLMDRPTWQLLSGDRVVADLIVYGGDFPWVNARLEPKEGFEEIRPIFEQELRLSDAIDENMEAWEMAYAQVRSQVKLRHPDGHLVPEFLLHIDGTEASWRWSDQPFKED
jgi:hypothetical protein